MPQRARNRNHRNPRTMGELISTLVFIGMAVWLLLEALSLTGQAPTWQVAGLFLSAFLSFLGALRFVIAQAWYSYRKGRPR
jgi:cation transport ATPase